MSANSQLALLPFKFMENVYEFVGAAHQIVGYWRQFSDMNAYEHCKECIQKDKSALTCIICRWDCVQVLLDEGADVGSAIKRNALLPIHIFLSKAGIQSHLVCMRRYLREMFEKRELVFVQHIFACVYT